MTVMILTDSVSYILALIGIVVIAIIAHRIERNWPNYNRDINELMREHDEYYEDDYDSL